MTVKLKCPVDEPLYWNGCYGSSKRLDKFITPESYAHPAKMSRLLCDRIFRHLEKLELIKKDSTIIDFMGGIGTTNLIASLRGYKTIGVELEPHFIAMQEANKKLLEKKCMRKIDWEIIQGDSRRLSEILNMSGGVSVVSPPYGEMEIAKGDAKQGMIEDRKNRRSNGDWSGYSKSAGQIGNLKDKPLVSVVSPPYQDMQLNGGDVDKRLLRCPADFKMSPYQQCRQKHYSTNPSNIGNLKDKPLVSVVSPPYQDMHIADRTQVKGHTFHLIGKKDGYDDGYSRNPTNIGNLKDNEQLDNSSYLGAMLKVYSEAYKSGISPLVLVTKNPTRNGVLRDLCGDTVKLITSCHIPLYCNCEGDKHEDNTKEIGEDNRMEKGKPTKSQGIQSEIYGKIKNGRQTERCLYQRKNMRYLREEDCELGGEVQKTCNRWRTLGATHGRDESEDKSKEGTTNIQSRDAGKTNGSIEKLLENSSEGTQDNSLHGLRDTNHSRKQEMQKMCIQESRTSKENERTTERETRLEQGEESATSIGREKCNVEGRNEQTEERSTLEKDTHDTVGKGQFYMSEMRSRSIHSSPQERVDTEPERNDRGCNISLQKVPLQGRWGTFSPNDICPKCGKWKLPDGKTINDVGYVIHDYHRAVLFKERDQQTLDGNVKRIPKGRLSFFKRLSYERGNVVAKYEDIIIAVIPEECA